MMSQLKAVSSQSGPALVTRARLAEGLGTFFLVFAGTGAIVINNLADGAITHVGVSLTFGLVVLALIYALGDVSGCHLNPAVSIAFAWAGRFPNRELPGYILSQAAGALVASVTIRTLFGTQSHLGATIPSGSAFQSFVLELLLALFLMFVILSVSRGSKETGALAGVAIGATVALEALFAGPICGASMNPVRSLAPALVAGRLESVWIYCSAPVLGALLAVPLDRLIRA